MIIETVRELAKEAGLQLTEKEQHAIEAASQARINGDFGPGVVASVLGKTLGNLLERQAKVRWELDGAKSSLRHYEKELKGLDVAMTEIRTAIEKG